MGAEKWEVMITRGVSEPWWFFSDWRESIIATYSFSNKKMAIDQYEASFVHFKQKTDHVKVKNSSMAAFWKDGETVFCESCDDDLQLYYGILIMCNDQPYIFSETDHVGSHILTIGKERE